MKNNTAIVIPIYKSYLNVDELYSFTNTLDKLQNRDVYIVFPKKIINFAETLKKYRNRIFLKPMPNYFFANISGYNKLMKSKYFYENFLDYEYLLIVQLDAIVFYDDLEYWTSINIDYIGAPWFKGYQNPKVPYEFEGVGNGGFSLRRVSSFIKVLSGFKYLDSTILYERKIGNLSNILSYIKNHLIFTFNFQPLQSNINEDVFWGIIVPKNANNFLVPKPEDAISFAFEMLPSYMYRLNGNKLPFGCHAWKKYEPDFWKKFIEIEKEKIE